MTRHWRRSAARTVDDPTLTWNEVGRPVDERGEVRRYQGEHAAFAAASADDQPCLLRAFRRRFGSSGAFGKQSAFVGAEWLTKQRLREGEP